MTSVRCTGLVLILEKVKKILKVVTMRHRSFFRRHCRHVQARLKAHNLSCYAWLADGNSQHRHQQSKKARPQFVILQQEAPTLQFLEKRDTLQQQVDKMLTLHTATTTLANKTSQKQHGNVMYSLRRILPSYNLQCRILAAQESIMNTSCAVKEVKVF